MTLRKLIAIHFGGNALLLWLAYLWLGVGESTRWRLVGSAAEAIVLLALACWLHGTTLTWFRTGGKVSPKVVALTVAAIAVLALYGLIAWAGNASSQPAFQLASWLTLHIRKPVKPATVSLIFQGAFWILRWVILPVALLPMASGVATRAWRGFGEFTWRGGWRYWLAVPILLLIGFWLPLVLIRWVPHFESFVLQFASFTLRALAAYSLMIASTFALAYIGATSSSLSGQRRSPGGPTRNSPPPSPALQ